ncbi:MobF family relaxase [Actinomycetospora straminea]|uniref:TrwC relaxase domain-containing protein n=1 Tax=Actinomycetospora straminea TaxID=663607 RepID=A0ABP9F8G5_9PSEU|nr:MobF family relaxase [Actinomycetospora straminea]MDD7934797.1 MobF family relaxase [Actinomycetospora straminea]
MLSVATGYNPDYLLKEVATGRENYYTGAVAEGEPPGRWWGAGAEALGLSGEVDAQDMMAIYSRFLDPRVEGFRDPSRWDELSEDATLGHAGRAYKSAEQLYAEALERELNASAERRDELRVEASKAVRQNVAFLDLTFSVQKSVTLLHTAFEAEEVKARAAGLDDDAAEWGRLRETVERAIWRGNDAALSYLQEHAGYARVGHHGGTAGRWIDAQNWVVASFFQHDSRDHDPQLHIHNATLNRQHSVDDGQWRTLDSRAIHRLKPAAAAVGERTTDEALIHDLGVAMVMRPDGMAREATAVDPGSRDMFSSRSHKISGRAAELIEAFEASRGRDATGLERDRIKRQATLATRAAKSHGGETREQFLSRVDDELRAEVIGGLTGVAHAARAQHEQDQAAPERFAAAEVIEAALEAVQARKTSFTHADLVREINALLPDHLGTPQGTDVAALLHGLADQAIALVEHVDQIEAAAPGEGLEPDTLRRRDGTSMYAAPGGRSYVTREHLRSENRLRAATAARDGERLTPSKAARFVEHLRGEGIELGVDQAAAVTGVLTSGARLETLIGPAGTGKSFVVGSLARAWSDPTHRLPEEPERRVFGLATAQLAADVLTDEGLTTANTARWLATQRRLDSAQATHRPALDADEPWRLRHGDLLVVDESSMADTAALAAVHAYADEAGAKLLLVGDPRQLGAVGAGGAMDLVAQSGARYDLADARRFTHEWERDASLRLRAGDPEVIKAYQRHGRLLDTGSLADAEASATRAWLADTLAGHRSLLVVDTNDAAARVSSSIRDELVRLGRVTEHGLPLRDGTTAGVGDIVQGRRLARDLAGYEGNRRGPVNREHYRVTGVRDDGALNVVVVAAGEPFHPRANSEVGFTEAAGERLVLPPEYVADHLTLSYAGTVHAAEGATVYSAHPVVTPRTDLNALYVGLSRGREANTAHVATLTGPDDAAQGSETDVVRRDPRAVLATILSTREATDEVHRSATTAQEDAEARAASVQTAGERFADVAHEAATERTARWLDALVAHDVLDPHDRQRVAAEDGTAGLTRLLRQAEIAGHDPAEVLRGAIADRPLDGARRVSDVLQGRIRAEHTFEPAGDTWSDWLPLEIDPATHRYLEALAEAADTRTRDLGEQVAAQPPVWALRALGAVPDDDAARDTWMASAGAIAAHRELGGHALDDNGDKDGTARTQPPDNPSDGRPATATEVLGSAPPRGHVEAYAAYRAAHRAADLPDHQRDELECSPAGHRVRVRAWEREQAWGPAYVENLLAGTRQAEARHRQTAELRRAEADAVPEYVERDRLAREADHASALAESLERHGTKLEQQSQTYAEWYAATAMTRALGEASAEYLAEQHAADEPQPAITAEEWLALDCAARHEDDAHRDITDIDLDERPQPTEQVTEADNDDSRRAPELDRAEDDRHADVPGAEERVDAGTNNPINRDDEPRAETDVPDIRDTADATPRGVDEDSIHAPDTDEVAAAAARAHEAAAELRNREALEARHEAEERAQQLAAWQEEDQPATAETLDASDDQEVADTDDYVDAEV